MLEGTHRTEPMGLLWEEVGFDKQTTPPPKKKIQIETIVQRFQIVDVSDIDIHPFRNKDSSSAFFDLAVLTVDPPFNFTDSGKGLFLNDVTQIWTFDHAKIAILLIP